MKQTLFMKASDKELGIVIIVINLGCKLQEKDGVSARNNHLIKASKARSTITILMQLS
jgi:hypothetical protein